MELLTEQEVYDIYDEVIEELVEEARLEDRPTEQQQLLILLYPDRAAATC